jgi:uncharacterized membrane protein
MVSRCIIHFTSLALICQTTSSIVGAFQLHHSTPTRILPKQQIARSRPQNIYSPETKLFVSSEGNNDEDLPPIERSVTPGCWNPTIRKTFTILSSIGMVETGYLSYLKLFNPAGINKICGDGVTSTISSCSSVLNSPYASIQLNEENAIPLTLLGFVAYTTVAALSAYPMLSSQTVIEEKGVDLDVNNRIAILCTTTSMATFSSFLLSLLFNTLHQSCPYCFLSAGLSLTMGFTAWFTGMLPTNNRENGVKLALGSFATTTIASLILFFGIDEAALTAYQNDVLASNGLSNNIVATAEEPQKNIPPPPITSKSSEQALKIGQDLKGLNTRFFGAYWCSHCYEQKQRLGKEAMANVQYIECSKEGLNSQNDLCKERGIPGYPTWEIGGNLYPGEMYLDELEEIIAKEKQKI